MRIFAHVTDAAEWPHKKISSRTVDTDVVVLVTPARKCFFSHIWQWPELGLNTAVSGYGNQYLASYLKCTLKNMVERKMLVLLVPTS